MFNRSRKEQFLSTGNLSTAGGSSSIGGHRDPCSGPLSLPVGASHTHEDVSGLSRSVSSPSKDKSHKRYAMSIAFKKKIFYISILFCTKKNFLNSSKYNCLSILEIPLSPPQNLSGTSAIQTDPTLLVVLWAELRVS